jgi:carbon storage regulator
MLVLSRKVGEQIVVPQYKLTVTVLDMTPGRVRLGIDAPQAVAVHRREVCRGIAAEAAAESEMTSVPLRVLVADPDEYQMGCYREHLGRSGAVVATAPTALACVDRLRDFAPDVLVLRPALLWGGADGVLAVMHEEPALRPAAVLLLTQGSDRSLLYGLSRFKVDDYQTKSLSPRELLERIRELCRSCSFQTARRRRAIPPQFNGMAVVH